MALVRGDARAAIAAHEGHEAGIVEDRLTLAFAHWVLGHGAEARRILDGALDLYEEFGDTGTLSHAAGDGKAVMDACRVLHLATRESAESKELLARTRGMRARYAARTGDFKTALADLEALAPSGNAIETGTTDAVVRLYRGDFIGAVQAFLEVIDQNKAQLPRDALLEIGVSLERTGHAAAAKDTFERVAQSDLAVAPLARQHMDAIDKWPAYPGEAVLLDQGPSETLMTGGPDGQGPRLFTSSRWVEEQQTVYGYAPTIFIPESAEDRTVEIEVGSEVPLRIEILPGVVPKDDHAWWATGHANVLTSEKAVPSPRLAWTAKAGTWTIFISRFLEKDAELRPCPLSSVKVTLRGPPSSK
jgi:hypothetical protein